MSVDILCLHVSDRGEAEIVALLQGSHVSMYVACNPCALSGPYRPRGAHGFWPLLVHFSGKSALFRRKLSDRIWKILADRGRGKLCLRRVRSEASFPAERGQALDSRYAPGQYVAHLLPHL